MARRFLSLLRLYSAAADPTGTGVGDIYYNTSTGLRLYNGTSWSGIVSSTGPTITDPVIDNIKASGSAVAADLYSEVTTGSITIGAGLTTGTLNIASVGTGVTNINIGHSNAIINLTGNVDLASVGASIPALATDANGYITSAATTGSSGSLVRATSPTFATSVITSSTSFDVFNTTATTVNAFGAATSLTLGASGGSATFPSPIVVGGVSFFYQPAPTAKNSTSVTLTIAELLTGIITTSYSGSAPTYTLPTGTACDAGILGGNLPVDRAFQWSVMGIGAATVTMAGNTGHTLTGTSTIAATDIARFLTRKTAANTFVTYRIS